MSDMLAPGSFLDVCVAIAFLLVGIALVLTVVRLVLGPSLADRVVALDMLAVLAMGFIALRVIITQQALFLEIAIALGLVAFLATVFFARLVQERGAELPHGYDTKDEFKNPPAGKTRMSQDQADGGGR
jgi:multicomponent Na+:H+ antiporter subunit F